MKLKHCIVLRPRVVACNVGRCSALANLEHKVFTLAVVVSAKRSDVSRRRQQETSDDGKKRHLTAVRNATHLAAMISKRYEFN